MTDRLSAFIKARLDEEAERAWAVHDVEKCDAMLYEEDMAAYASRRDPDCDCGIPAQIRRDVAAKRALIAAILEAVANSTAVDNIQIDFWVADSLLGLIASAWSGHPDYAPALADLEAE